VFLLLPKEEVGGIGLSVLCNRMEGQRPRKALADEERIGLEEENPLLTDFCGSPQKAASQLDLTWLLRPPKQSRGRKALFC
jgi:hypothetical protein